MGIEDSQYGKTFLIQDKKSIHLVGKYGGIPVVIRKVIILFECCIKKGLKYDPFSYSAEI